ncbi:MAG: Crp/Fnr family transcriptional regulator [Gammaproteobacteria bacterium]|nr:Crp/Fnr family transcriptional regulator [Gammaproteobacteria bacterium]NNJ97064.1 Crp/Fnr family transcriptional regulator [Gammaproteobacteria bacterium]
MLNKHYVFSELAPKETERLTQHSTTRTYHANTILISEGDTTDSLYVVLEGKVKVFASDHQGKEVILNILGPGEYFGELALLDDQPRSASVKTMVQTKLMVITKNDFKKSLAGDPEMAYKLIKVLIGRVRALTSNVKSLALLDVYGRVARNLLDLAENVDDEMVIVQKLTHQDIADMVGASREMVSRILKDLVSGGYITIKNKRYTINEKLPPGW